MIILIFTVFLKSSKPTCDNVCGTNGGCLLSNGRCVDIPNNECTTPNTWCPTSSGPIPGPIPSSKWSCSIVNRENKCIKDSEGKYDTQSECYNASNMCTNNYFQCPTPNYVSACNILSNGSQIKFANSGYITENCTIDQNKGASFKFIKTDRNCNNSCEYFISTTGDDDDNKYLGAFVQSPDNICTDNQCPTWIQYISPPTLTSNPSENTNGNLKATDYLMGLDNYKWIIFGYNADYIVIQNKYSKSALTFKDNNVVVNTVNLDNLDPNYQITLVAID